jgi:hypothetical protein
MVGEAEIIVETPVKHFLAPEFHPRGDLPLKFGKNEVSIGLLGILPERAHVPLDLGKNVHCGRD